MLPINIIVNEVVSILVADKMLYTDAKNNMIQDFGLLGKYECNRLDIHRQCI